jgi:aminopeptidase N
MSMFRENRNRVLWFCLLSLLIFGGAAVLAVPRQYAPARRVDITHVTIDVTPNFEARTVAGTTTIRFTPIAELLTELKLDAIDLDVTSVESEPNIAGYSATDETITITFSPPVLPGEERTIKVTYSAEPRQGMYFRTPELGYPEADRHLFTQGESHEARHWYPNFDYPNERFSSEVICHVPKEMTVLSNGRLISEQIDSETGLKAVHWLQEKPHVNYLIALVAGMFEKIEARHKDIPLAFYTVPSKIQYAQNSFQDTADMVAFYEEEIGIPYPWDKYYQVTVSDFVAGGMENTTLTILTDGTLFTDASENIHSSQGLVAHELVHQWFGDYVTCKDWSHLWLNEGFAVYYEDLYDRHKNGRDSFLHGLYGSARQVVSRDANAKPIVDRTYANADDQFDYRAYGKGGWVLHMLRSQLGERLFRRVIQTYMERHALDVVVTEDLRSVIEELSGRPFDRFFDQWLYHGGCPELEVSYEWQEEDKLAKVSVKQVQKQGDDAVPFYLPTKVRFWFDGWPTDRDIVIDRVQHDFYFALRSEPDVVRFDPELTLLAKVTFAKPKKMLYAQIENKLDVVGRLRAADELEKKEDKQTVAKLKDALNSDPFYGVRRSAAIALAHIHTDEAFAALTKSRDQSDARVRHTVVELIGDFYREESFAISQDVIAKEKNPAILAAAILNVGRYHGPQTRELVSKYLRSTSYRNELAEAAVRAIRRLDDPFYIDDLMVMLAAGDQPTTRSLVWGLSALARIADQLDDRTEVREFLAGFVNHPNEDIASSAINALGTLGDPKAIPIVETFRGTEPRNSKERRAQRALEKLREKKQLVPEEITELRKIVDELKDETKKLKEDLEEMKKRDDAKENGTAESTSD